MAEGIFRLGLGRSFLHVSRKAKSAESGDSSLLCNLGRWGFGNEDGRLRAAPLNSVTREREHQQAGDESGQGQELNGDWTIRTQRIEYSTDQQRASGASDGIGGPGKCIEGGEAPEPEVTAQKVGRDVSLAAHAEANESSGDQAHGEAVGHR